MRTLTSSLARWIPIVALITAGCTDQPQPSSPEAKANQPALKQPPDAKEKTTAAKVKKPKVIGNMTGPTQLVD
jgi:hypothetical protein